MAKSPSRAVEPPGAAANQTNQALLDIATRRLRELFAEAEAGRMYGTIGVTVSFEYGVARLVRRAIDGSDKAG